MLSLPPTVRLFLCLSPVDCRRGFDGLAQIVRDELGADPLSGHLFIFRNRRGDRLKILYWDRDGLVQWYKRLEQGVFRFPRAAAAGRASLEIRSADLAMVLDGVVLDKVQRTKRYQRPVSA